MKIAQCQYCRQFGLRIFGLLIAASLLFVNTVKVSADTTLADISAADKLLQLAQKQFGSAITSSDEKLFRAVATGEVANYKNTNNPTENNPDNAARWSSNRCVRADRLVWLCTTPDASNLVNFRGVQIMGARIDGPVDLNSANLTFPIKVMQSAFTEDLFLTSSHLSSLDLSGTHVKAVEAKWMKVDGGICLSCGFKADGMVNLHGSSIGADLDCGDAQISCTNRALDMDEAKIAGSVWLSSTTNENTQFKVEGLVSLANSTIGGKLNCTGSKFVRGKDPNAIFACGANIGGNVDLLRVKAQGTVSFSDASIGGNLDCGSGTFQSDSEPNGWALKFERAKIGGSVWLNNGFLALGPITIEGATIGGNIECVGGKFIQDKYNTSYFRAPFTKINGSVKLVCTNVIGRVDFENAEVVGEFVWKAKLNSKVQLDLQSAKVGTLTDDRTRWPLATHLNLQDFIYDKIQPLSPGDAESRIEWLHLQSTNTFQPQTYEQLAAVFRNIGQEDDAVKVMIEKNKDYAKTLKWANHGQFMQCFWYKWFGRFIGFGYNTWNAFWVSFVFVMIGWSVFHFGWSRSLIMPTDEKDCGFDFTGIPSVGDNYPVFSSFIYSLEMFVPLVNLGMNDKWRPYSNRATDISYGKNQIVVAGRWLRWYLWIHILAGWVLTTLWVGGLTGLIKT